MSSGPDPFGQPTVVRLRELHGGRVAAVLRRADAVLHALAGATLVLLMLWTVVDILGRAGFGRPLRGTVELTQLAVVVLVYLGLAEAEDRDAHISVDLLFVRLRERGQLVLRILASTISLAVIAVLTWRLYDFTGVLRAGDYTTGVLRIPEYPVALIAVVGSTAFGLAVLANLAVYTRALLAVGRAANGGGP